MTSRYVKVNRISGGRETRIYVQPDHKQPGNVFVSGCPMYSISPDQLAKYVNLLVDVMEEVEL